MSDTSHKQSRDAAYYVSVASAWFVSLLLLYLFLSAVLQHMHFDSYGVGKSFDACAADTCRVLMLEADIQNMRSARVGYALIYRFSLLAAAIVVSLAMVVLGSVLVFDRVRSNRDVASAVRDMDHTATDTTGDTVATNSPPISGNHLSITYRDVKLLADSSFPGFLMVVLGAATLTVSLYFINNSPIITVTDAPVFLQDTNTWRIGLGNLPGVVVEPPGAASSTPEAAIGLRTLEETPLLFDTE